MSARNKKQVSILAASTYSLAIACVALYIIAGLNVEWARPLFAITYVVEIHISVLLFALSLVVIVKHGERSCMIHAIVSGLLATGLVVLPFVFLVNAVNGLPSWLWNPFY